MKTAIHFLSILSGIGLLLSVTSAGYCLGSLDPQRPLAKPTTASTSLDLPFAIENFESSPDGKWLAIQNHSGELWMSPTARPQWKKVAVGATSGSWRPDSRSYLVALSKSVELYYASYPPERSNLVEISVPRLTVKRWNLPFYALQMPAYSPDGRFVVALADQPFRFGGSPRHLLPPQMPGDDGTYYGRLVLIRRDGKLAGHYRSGMKFPFRYDYPRQPRWSDDGRTIAYARHIDDVLLGSAIVFDVHKRRSTYTRESWPHPNDVFWLGKRLVFSGSTYSADGATILATVLASIEPGRRYSVFRSDRNHYVGNMLGTHLSQRGEFELLFHPDTTADEIQLWRGKMAPKIRLTKKLASFSASEANFSARLGSLWLLSPDRKRLRSVPINGPY